MRPNLKHDSRLLRRTHDLDGFGKRPPQRSRPPDVQLPLRRCQANLNRRRRFAGNHHRVNQPRIDQVRRTVEGLRRRRAARPQPPGLSRELELRNRVDRLDNREKSRIVAADDTHADYASRKRRIVSFTHAPIMTEVSSRGPVVCRICAAIVLIPALLGEVRADILELHDGTILNGRVIKHDDRKVIFRIELGDSGSITRTFRIQAVKRLEREEPASQPASRPAAAPNRKIQPVARTEHFEQMLREAFELLDDRDDSAALNALQRLVQRAPEKILEDLDRQCVAARGEPLAVLIARLRLDDALRGPGDGFDLGFATRYESAALGALLKERYDALLEQNFDGRSLRRWIERVDEFDRATPAAAPLVRAAQQAASLIGARIKHERALLTARDDRKALIELRDGLSRVIARVSALPGFTARQRRLDPTDPAAERIRQLRERIDESDVPGSQPVDHAPSGSIPASQPSSEPAPPKRPVEPEPLGDAP